MPGHMNVFSPKRTSPTITSRRSKRSTPTSVRRTSLIVGANDIVNPAAKTNPQSPIYGMPVFSVEHSRTVMVIKRGLGSGFSGIENDLFVQSNTVMVLGDARKTLQSIIGELGAETTARRTLESRASPRVTASVVSPRSARTQIVALSAGPRSAAG